MDAMDAVVYPGFTFAKVKQKLATVRIAQWALLAIAVVLIKIAAFFPFFIERYYSRGVYPYISIFFRKLFGWLPFSMGDLFYFAAGAWLLVLLIKLIRALIRKSITRQTLQRKGMNVLRAAAIIYIVFNLAWGLNYTRPGIASQLGLKQQPYNVGSLKTITGMLLVKMNACRRSLQGQQAKLRPYTAVFTQAQQAYYQASMDYPFMAYRAPSVKRSMYGRMGNYLGFLGYYNPFSGEAQLNLTMPRFLIPYVTCHEMAHQLGYASESEASFVGYLAASKSTDSLFKYSTYFDLFTYANRELFVKDSLAAKANVSQLDPLVKEDMTELRNYWRKSENGIEPLIKVFYDQYLKANHQEKGLYSYNEVTGWLIAYYKRYGVI